MTVFFFFGLHLTTWVKGPTLTLCPGPLNFSGWPCEAVQNYTGYLGLHEATFGYMKLDMVWLHEKTLGYMRLHRVT